MNKLILMTSLVAFAIGLPASAQRRAQIPDPYENITKEDKLKLDQQARGIFNALNEVVKKPSASTVMISNMHQRLVFGTIVKSPLDGDPVIVTKWSEVKDYYNRLVVSTAAKKDYQGQITGVYPEHDLALINISAPKSEMVTLENSDSVTPKLGEFITLARHDASAEGFGVVSVHERSLQESSKGYLGVVMSNDIESDDGVLLKVVSEGSPADQAGLEIGDRIVKIGDDEISSFVEMRHALQGSDPGTKVNLRYLRDGKLKKTVVTLGSRADDPRIQTIPTQRMDQMERMGRDLSEFRKDFPNVIQTDMPIESNDVGAPVVNLDGKFVGVAIASASRIKTLIIPASTIFEVMKTEPRRLK